MSNVASQNRFAFLGNDDDGEEKSTAPVKTVDKPTTRTTKRGVEPQAPQAPARGQGGGRRGGAHGNEDAFRDRGAGSDRNHRRPLEEAPHDAPRGGYGARTRGGQGSRRPREFDDRHPSRAGGHGASEKQAAHSWGSPGGDAELKDEEAGEAIAQSEQKEALAEDGAPAEPSEPEEKTVSYDDYLAQQAEKKLALDSSFKVREANEGSKLDKKWANAKALEKDEEEFISGHGGKTKRERERKTKQTIDFDPRFIEAERPRGGGRGGRAGRGGRGGERGGERGRGGHFSGERGGYRGGYGGRGGRDGGASAPINTDDKSAFPSLGA